MKFVRPYIMFLQNLSGLTFRPFLRTRHFRKINRFQRICGIIRKHLKKTRTDTQMKFYKVLARPTILYGSETWVTTTRDMTRLEAAEMRLLSSVKGYTRLDKIRSEVIRK
jgi:hypothetical protein